ncbi:hypothetical protein, partial [Mycobacterium marinum]|uniref:hypothetical protein n=1 Tax=Mycobacterium marinum TaxID=1781 RepID=UPI0035654317
DQAALAASPANPAATPETALKPFVARGEPGAARAALAALATRAAGPTVAVVAGVASFAAGPTVTTPAAFEMGRVAGGT